MAFNIKMLFRGKKDINNKDNQSKEISAPKSELEQITDELIEESLRDLQKSFNEILSSTELFTKDSAEDTLKILINSAIAKRSALNGRIEKSVEEGAYFDRYYGKMRSINVLTNDTYRSIREYEHYHNLFLNLYKEYQEKTGEKIELDTSYTDSKVFVADIADYLEEKRKVYLEKEQTDGTEDT